MAARTRARRRLWPVVLVIVTVLVVIAAVAVWLGRRPPPPPGPAPGPVPTPPPGAQPASCPDVQMVAVPGTWESSPDDDPHHPSANPNALLLNVTQPVAEHFDAGSGDDGGRVDVVTVPYVAQFNRPFAPPETTYDDSRAQGTAALEKILSDRHAECPLTTYVLTGFSQGAVIAGDVAAQIGQGSGPVPADSVLGVGLVADGRRKAGAPGSAAQQLGVSGGEGAEVMLGGLHDVPGFPGTTMTGARPGGFGALADRTVQLCAPGDLICDAPSDLARDPLGTLAKLGAAVTAPIHAQYNVNPFLPGGQTATGYLVDWAEKLIDGAPHPDHD